MAINMEEHKSDVQTTQHTNQQGQPENPGNEAADNYCCDFLLSIGPHCKPALSLKRSHLREFSAPLDWMIYPLSTALHLYQTHFDDYFSTYEVDRENPEGAIGKLRVIDTKNQILSVHHFPKDMWLNSSYPRFKSKMNTRIERLEKRLKNASSIVLVSERSDSQDDLLSFLRSFSEIYPHLKIRLINIRHDEKMPYDAYRQETIYDDGSLSYLEYIINETEQGVQTLEGNSYIWTKILANYSTPGYNAIKNEWLQLRNDNKQIILYGAGSRCIYLLNWCSAIGMPVDGIAVSLMNNNPEEINRVKVKPYPSYPKDASIIISIENKAEAKEIRGMLHSQGYTSVYCVDSNMKLISTDE